METRSLRAAAFRGALWTTALAFPLAALCALVYRFPIPFGGYMSGPSAMLPALLAALFYGVLGGFLALAGGGAAGGALAYFAGRPDRGRVDRLTLAIATGLAGAAVVVLAVLDQLIGPW